jgi:CHAD domain-containing protein
MRRARRKLTNRKLFTLVHCTRKVKQHAAQRGHPRTATLDAMLSASVRSAYEEWRAALGQACENFEPADIHAFRIKTKRLRYRVELLRDLGDAEAEAAFASLRLLQDGLGEWHDHGELARLTAQALAEPRFFLEQLRVTGSVLRKLARDHAIMEERTRRLLTDTRQNADTSALHRWVNDYCAETPERMLRPSDQ